MPQYLSPIPNVEQPAVIAAVGAATSATYAAPTQSASAVATTGATNSSPYGFTGAAQADALVAAVNALRTDLIATNAQLAAVAVDLTNVRTRLAADRTAINAVVAAQITRGDIAAS